ncbi:glycosyltransferase [Vibrio splendidus]|uniref:glycosyltransferase n=1 Tax=Vibrio splendidus TaxID=29497 RepID=UPI000D38F107|nr:glycosyltransferase [Vibrio splendidus]PTO86897.1 glycosyltransferase [Vibrio splendidus]PTP47536.1 glycosyltransferase [Vibrio splendidus]
MNKKTVAFALPDVRGGGAEAVVLRLLSALARDYELLLFLGVNEGERASQIPSHVTVIELGTKSGLKAVPAIVRNVKKYNVDVLIGTLSMAHSVSLCSVLLSRHKCKCIARLGNTISKDLDNFSGIKKKLMYMYQSVLSLSDEVIVQSSYMYDDYFKVVKFQDNDKVRVIYNPLNSKDIILSSEYESEIKVGEHDIVFLGRLSYQKDIDTAVRAFSIYVKEHPNAYLHILGDGPERDLVLKVSEQEGIIDKVLIHGFIDNPYPILRQSKLLLSTSLYEGFSNVILEAVTLGKAVVVTNCPGGNSEIIQDGVNGYLFSCGDFTSAASKMLSVSKLSSVGYLKDDFLFANVVDNYMRTIDD